MQSRVSNKVFIHSIFACSLVQNKIRNKTTPPPRNNDELALNPKRAFFITEMWEGVVLIFHLNCSRWNLDLGQNSNGNGTEWSPIRSVIIRVMEKSDDRAAGFRFVYHEYDRQKWTR